MFKNGIYFPRALHARKVLERFEFIKDKIPNILVGDFIYCGFLERLQKEITKWDCRRYLENVKKLNLDVLFPESKNHDDFVDELD